jgi:hypothetical protein
MSNQRSLATRKRLTPQMKHAVELMATGMAPTEVAREVGVAETTLRDWRMRSPVFRAQLAELVEPLQVPGAVHARRALEVLAELAEDPSDNATRFRAASKLVDLNTKVTAITETAAPAVVLVVNSEDVAEARRVVEEAERITRDGDVIEDGDEKLPVAERDSRTLATAIESLKPAD